MKSQKKVLFVGHDFKFLDDYIDYLDVENESVEVSVMKLKGHNFKADSKLLEKFKQFDVVFCEWALGNAKVLSNIPEKKFKLVVRLHAQELRERREETLSEICWDNIDSVIFISPYLKELAETLQPKLKVNSIYIPNYVSRKKYREDHNKVRTYAIGLVGIIPPLKRIDKALTLIDMLNAQDCRFLLKVKSKTLSDLKWAHDKRSWDNWYSSVFDSFGHLFESKIVQFEEFSDDVAGFYSSLDYILSTSDTEGSHQAVAEAMFSGCVPIIRNWGGARAIYGDNVYDTVEDMVNRILQIEKEDEFVRLSSICKAYSFNCFSEKIVFNELNRILEID